MRRLPLLALAFALACSEDGAQNDDPPAEDAGMTPPVDAAVADTATPIPDMLSCPSMVLFGEIVAGTSTRTLVACEIVDGSPEASIAVDGLEVDAPFAATLTLSEPVLLEVSFTPTGTTTADHHATLTIRYTSLGEALSATIEVHARIIERIDWDPLPPALPCAADQNAPLLDRALGMTELDRDHFGFSEADLLHSDYYALGYLDDEMMLSWFFEARAHPHRAGCLQTSFAGVLDELSEQPHAATNTIRHAAILVDRPVPEDMRPLDVRALPGTFEEALAALCEDSCGAPVGELTPELQAALTPLLWALKTGIDARRARDPGAAAHDAAWWQAHGGWGVLLSTQSEFYDVTDIGDRNYLLGIERTRLNGAAAQIAYAIEDTDWTPFIGRMGVRYDLDTPAGAIRIRDGAADRYQEDGDPVLLLLDLGGDDVHLDDVATNRSATNAVSIAIDLAGDDRYEYEVRTTVYDRPGLLPADDGFRYRGDMNYGNITLSRHFRQGAARNGIAMLFDLGSGSDHYQSLLGSQGYAHQGVGVLFDAGGSDVYLAEEGAQGAAQYGIGLLIDVGEERDEHRAFTNSQGFGYVQGAGFLVNSGGNDSYSCDHGDPLQGGIPLYFSPQLPNAGNTSMCQGAGFGRRGDEPGTYFSGGLGILRDARGDDTYEASVFGQGTGYWQGTGILSDGDGSDRFDAYWYVQAGAAHYALAILTNAGTGSDVFNGTRPPINVHLGAGHDYSTAVYIQENGNTEYHLGSLTAGSSHCNGIGLFVDNGGDDQYFANSDYGSGSGSVGDECLSTRPEAVSIGVMIDGGGMDSYTYPTSTFAVPQEGGTWGHSRFGLASEHGAGLDDEGETGVHAN